MWYIVSILSILLPVYSCCISSCLWWCMCVHVCARIGGVSRGKPGLSFLSCCLSILIFSLRHGLSFSWNSARRLTLLDRGPHDPPVSHFLSVGITWTVMTRGFFLHRFWESNSSPHLLRTVTLLTEPGPSSWRVRNYSSFLLGVDL